MSQVQNLPLRERKIDIFFAIMFTLFALSAGVSDTMLTIGVPLTPDSSNPMARSVYAYAIDADPLFLHPPVWMRIAVGLSAFVYAPFCLLLSYALVRGKNWIQFPATIYATSISVITGVIVFGVEFFGEPEWRTQNPAKFLAYNLPYVLVPLLLLARMRKPLPFTRKF